MPGSKGGSPKGHCSQKDISQQQHEVEFKEATGQTLLFFVYRKEFDQRVRNAIIRFSGRIKSYEGRILGISTNLMVDAPSGSPWLQRQDWCVCALGFPTQEKARLWFICEPEVKQHDFPPPADSFMCFSVPIRYVPQPGGMTFCWTEIKDIKSKGSYQSEYVDKVTTLFDSKGINHGLVFVKESERHKVERLKDCWLDQTGHFRLDLYSSQEQYFEIYNSENFRSLKQARESLSDTTTVLFTIDPKIA